MKKPRLMKVESGSLKWSGMATNTDDAIIKALESHPERLGVLVRVHDGWRWFYMDSIAAVKLAGYSVYEKNPL